MWENWATAKTQNEGAECKEFVRIPTRAARNSYEFRYSKVKRGLVARVGPTRHSAPKDACDKLAGSKRWRKVE
jgi:hypothetical protein